MSALARAGRAADDERWMAAALRFGRRGMGLAAPNPSVGALILRDGVVVASVPIAAAASRPSSACNCAS